MESSVDFTNLQSADPDQKGTSILFTWFLFNNDIPASLKLL